MWDLKALFIFIIVAGVIVYFVVRRLRPESPINRFLERWYGAPVIVLLIACYPILQLADEIHRRILFNRFDLPTTTDLLMVLLYLIGISICVATYVLALRNVRKRMDQGRCSTGKIIIRDALLIVGTAILIEAFLYITNTISPATGDAGMGHAFVVLLAPLAVLAYFLVFSTIPSIVYYKIEGKGSVGTTILRVGVGIVLLVALMSISLLF